MPHRNFSTRNYLLSGPIYKVGQIGTTKAQEAGEVEPKQRRRHRGYTKTRDDGVIYEMKHLKIGKSPGPDNVPNNLLKGGREVLAGQLAELFNRILNDERNTSKMDTQHHNPNIQKGENLRSKIVRIAGALRSSIWKNINAYQFRPKLEYMKHVSDRGEMLGRNTS